jgi:hypothetical protein
VIQAVTWLLSLFSRTGAAIWPKTNFGPTGHHHQWSSPFCTYALIPALLPFISPLWKLCFMRIFSIPLWFSLHHLNYQNSLPSIGETKKTHRRPSQMSRVGGGQQTCFCLKNSIWKGSVRLYVVVMQEPVLLSLKLKPNSSHIFMQSLQNITVVCGIDCMAC